MGLFSFLFGDDDKEKDADSFGLFSLLGGSRNDDKLEDEMEDYDLEEWQKELVRNGDYDVTSFDEEDLEEDDYYSDDD